MGRPRTPDHDKVIARLPEDVRLRILDACVGRGLPVVVEHGYSRQLDGSQHVTAGTPVGVANGANGYELILRPHSIPAGVYRLLAIPAARVIRVRMAALHDTRRVEDGVASTYTAGEVLAGPPLEA